MVVDDETRKTTEYVLSRPEAGKVSPGEHAPTSQNQGLSGTFMAKQVAHAFDIDVAWVHNAMRGELGLPPGARVDSRQAQQLAEAVLTDRSIDLRQAALINLGAFQSRVDHEWGLDEERDRLTRRGDRNDEDRGGLRPDFRGR